mgnify:CR=1 FL=1
MSSFINNPDYPTNVGSFAQHTYQGQQSFGGGFYYGGAGFGTMTPDNSPRRADGFAPQAPQQYGYGYAAPAGYGYPQQPVQPMAPATPAPTGIGQMLTTPEKNVQPFSSYPPSNGQPGFNQLMTDARRADAFSAQATGNNPWATSQPAPAPVPMTPQPQYNYYTPQPQQLAWGVGANDASAMYGYQQGQNPFEKKQGMNMWDNMYAAPQPYVQNPPSQMQWSSTPVQTQPPTVYQYQVPPQQQYPQFAQVPPPQQETYSWMELSKKSWG